MRCTRAPRPNAAARGSIPRIRVLFSVGSSSFELILIPKVFTTRVLATFNLKRSHFCGSNVTVTLLRSRAYLLPGTSGNGRYTSEANLAEGFQPPVVERFCRSAFANKNARMMLRLLRLSSSSKGHLRTSRAKVSGFWGTPPSRALPLVGPTPYLYSSLGYSGGDRGLCRSTTMYKVLICGGLVWADTEAKEIFGGLANMIVSPYCQ